MNISEMKKYTGILYALLQNPEPGLFSWNRALYDVMFQLNQAYAERSKSIEVK